MAPIGNSRREAWNFTPETFFSHHPPFWNYRAKYAPMAARQHSLNNIIHIAEKVEQFMPPSLGCHSWPVGKWCQFNCKLWIPMRFLYVHRLILHRLATPPLRPRQTDGTCAWGWPRISTMQRVAGRDVHRIEIVKLVIRVWWSGASVDGASHCRPCCNTCSAHGPTSDTSECDKLIDGWIRNFLRELWRQRFVWCCFRVQAEYSALELINDKNKIINFFATWKI